MITIKRTRITSCVYVARQIVEQHKQDSPVHASSMHVSVGRYRYPNTNAHTQVAGRHNPTSDLKSLTTGSSGTTFISLRQKDKTSKYQHGIVTIRHTSDLQDRKRRTGNTALERTLIMWKMNSSKNLGLTVAKRLHCERENFMDILTYLVAHKGIIVKGNETLHRQFYDIELSLAVQIHASVHNIASHSFCICKGWF